MKTLGVLIVTFRFGYFSTTLCTIDAWLVQPTDLWRLHSSPAHTLEQEDVTTHDEKERGAEMPSMPGARGRGGVGAPKHKDCNDRVSAPWANRTSFGRQLVW